MEDALGYGDRKRRMQRLREERAQVLDTMDQDRLRGSHGEKLVSAIAAATGKPLSLEDFTSKSQSAQFAWPSDIRDANGLVAAYISRSDANSLLECVRDQVMALSGGIGFHEKPYPGQADLQGVDPVSLLVVAESTEDTVIFYSDTPAGILMLDCYASPPGDRFSVVVQGGALLQELAPCFARPKGRT